MLRESIGFLLMVVALFFIQPLKAQAQPKVLAEMFSNTDCKNCKTPDEAFESFMHNNPSYGIVRIAYHNEVPNPTDTFYIGSKFWTDYRSRTFYGVGSDP